VPRFHVYRAVLELAAARPEAVDPRRLTRVEEAVLAATRNGATALRRNDIGHLGIGARADAVVLDAPSYTHLVYRPGVPLVRTTLRRGVLQG
jgi:imidazolonepropionase